MVWQNKEEKTTPPRVILRQHGVSCMQQLVLWALLGTLQQFPAAAACHPDKCHGHMAQASKSLHCETK